MKITSHIFTIYMLALMLVPCGDGGGGILEMANHLFGVEHLHNSDHDQHSNNCGDDTCTPFCICSCCSTLIDTPPELPFHLESPPPIPETTPSFTSNIILSSFFSPIWQPPKLS